MKSESSRSIHTTVKHATKMLSFAFQAHASFAMLPQDSGHILISKFTGSCIINQIKEVTMQIVCFLLQWLCWEDWIPEKKSHREF